jgi:hypothetical protein
MLGNTDTERPMRTTWAIGLVIVLTASGCSGAPPYEQAYMSAIDLTNQAAEAYEKGDKARGEELEKKAAEAMKKSQETQPKNLSIDEMAKFMAKHVDNYANAQVRLKKAKEK